MYRTLSYIGLNFDHTFLHHMVTHIRRFQCDFKILNLDMEKEQETSSVTIRITAPNLERLNECTGALLELGMSEDHNENAIFRLASKDGFAPDDFYHLDGTPITVYFKDHWHSIPNIKPNTVVVLEDEMMRTIFLDQIKKNDPILCGKQGIRLENCSYVATDALESHSLSYTKHSFIAKTLNALESQAYRIWHVLQENKLHKAKTVLMLGSSLSLTHHLTGVLHLIKEELFQGYILSHQLAVADLAQAFSIKTEVTTASTLNPMALDHQSLKTINHIRGYGSIQQCYQAGALQQGILHHLISHEHPFIIPLQIYAHAFLPETLTHPYDIRESLLKLFQDVKTVLILGYDESNVGYISLLPEQANVICVYENEEHQYNNSNQPRKNITTYNANIPQIIETMLQLL